MTDGVNARADTIWKRSVDEKLADGHEKFETLQRGQDEIKVALDANTTLTNTVVRHLDAHSKKLDEHITQYGQFAQQVQPAVDIIVSLKSFARGIGNTADFLGRVARWFRRAVVWIAPIVALAVALWGATHDKSRDAWNVLVEWFR